MSLIHPYEQLWDMPLDGEGEGERMPRWAGNIIYGFLAFVFKICFRYRVDHRENLGGFRKKSGVLLISNHTSFLDVVFIYLAGRPSQWVRFLGRDDMFKNAGGFVGHILSRVGAFPVKRDTADLSAVKRAVRLLKTGEVVGIMPEGTRRGKGTKESEIHGGAALIARMAKVPILPMTVRNAEYIKEEGKFLRFPQVTIEYGNPLLVSDFDFLPKDDRLDGCSWYAMRECFALSQNVPRDQVDMVALFPEGRDFTFVFAQHVMPEHTTEELMSDISSR